MPSYILSLENWLHSMEDKHLTIGDISIMKSGDSKKFLCIDRNFYDFWDIQVCMI